MPILSKHQPYNFDLFIWSITEPIEFFKEKLQIPDNQFKLLQKKYSNADAFQQWLASRLGLATLFNCSYLDFKKSPSGKLEWIDQTTQLSISHSGSYIAVAKSETEIGIDLQVPTAKLARIAKKYIAADVLNKLKEQDAYLDYLHLYWGIKEALFKAYGLGKVNFIEHLHINPFLIMNKGYTTATITKPDYQATFQVFYEKTTDYYLCVVTKE